MKTLKITTDNKISVVDVNFNDFKAIQQAIGGYFENVKALKLWDYFKAPVVMIVDEEGVILGLLVGPDITGLGDRDAEQWMEKMLKDFPELEREEVEE